ncbi:hypothetical protein [Sphingomonas sp. Leaf37]|uniref:hypothetical protein n=1 Tax=Sphingomonas sp. Leaf37 TaxID=2876552 RepID=UPI001E3C2A94|nr:hypothetical protein [Sphingomonas sp. Leaf37]
MLKVDGTYLYKLGGQLNAISSLAAADTPRIQLMFDLVTARGTLSDFVYRSIFSSALRSLIQPATNMIATLLRIAPDFGEHVDYNEVIPSWQISGLKTEFSQFEAILKAILQTADLYYVSQKGGFDTAILTESGETLFPSALKEKVPEAVPDIRSAARCLAFELPTAAAFHFHRANESVLRRYFDQVAGADSRPASRNMGDYINIMKTKGVGDQRILEVLKGLKDLHRNPLMHPDDSIDTIDEALSLYAAVRAAIGYMVDRITTDPQPVMAPLPLEIPSANPRLR